MSIKKIREDIIAHYEQPSEIKAEHDAKYPLWQQQKPIASSWHTVGRIVVAPELLQRALADLQHSRQIAVSYINGHQDEVRYVHGPTVFLTKFLGVLSHRLCEVAQQDVARFVPDTSSLAFSQQTIAGPYQYDSSNAWHRDDSEPGSINYLTTICGPATEYASGSFGNHNFGASGDEYLQDTSLITSVSRADIGSIAVHHGTFAVHQAPPAEYAGQPRIFSSVVMHAL